MRSVSVVTAHPMTMPEVDALMTHLTATHNEGGWQVTRSDRTVWIDLATDDLHLLFSDDELHAIGTMLRGRPSARLAIMFEDNVDEFAYRMSIAIAKAVADQWTAVFDDHAGETFLVNGPDDGLISR